jgi:hypothetical protein
VTLHVGTGLEEWRAEHQAPFDREGTLAVQADGTILVDAGDGALRSLADLLGEHFEVRRDALGDRFVGRVRLRVDLLATPVPPPGWVDGRDDPSRRPGAVDERSRGDG